MERGQRLEVEVVGLTALGDGTALADGVELQIPGALPGERVRVRVEHRSRQVARAWTVLEDVLRRSEARREPPCPHQGQCAGCPWMVANEASQRAFKRELLRDRFGIDVDRVVFREEAELGYRWSSKRVAGLTRDGLTLGSYRRGTHAVASMAGCLVEHPNVARAADELEHVARARGVVPAPPGPFEPSAVTLRSAWIRTDGDERTIVALVGSTPNEAEIERLASALKEPAAVTWSAARTERGDGLRGSDTRVLCGDASMTLHVAGVSVEVGATGFVQPNPRVAALAYEDLMTTASGDPVEGRVALDLYAGAGATTALLRKRFDDVLACDSDPELARGLGVPPSTVEQLLARRLEEPRRAVDLVVADPPRSGLSAEVVSLLLRLRPARVHLMSCSASSLARDLAALGAAEGGYELEGCRAYDTLPQTPHVELVAWLVRRVDG